MKITLICVGQLKSGPELDLIKDYLKRFKWQVSIKEIPVKKGISGDVLKAHEATAILAAIPASAPLIALDERGDNLDSQQFANLIQSQQTSGQSSLALCIGGADGLHESVRQRAFKTISFGKLTWPHMLVRIMVVEQLYRAQQILANHPYHRG